MAPFRLDGRDMVKFIQLYKDRPALWHPGLADYKGRGPRFRLLSEIAAEMNIPQFGPREVALKIKNIRTTFRQEERKVLESRESSPEEIYCPRLHWYGLVDSFLGRDRFQGCAEEQRSEGCEMVLIKSESDWDTSSVSDGPSEDPLTLHPSDAEWQTSEKDEFYYFTKSLVVQLRKMPLDRALNCMQRMMAVVTEERLATNSHLLHTL